MFALLIIQSLSIENLRPEFFVEFRSLLKLNFQTGLFDFNGCMNIGLQNRFQLDYFANTREPDLARGLHMLRLLDQNAPASRRDN